MAKPASNTSKPDVAVIAALSANPVALTAYMAAFAAPAAAPIVAAKVAAPANLTAIAAAMAQGTCEVRSSTKGKPFACIKFQFGDRSQVANIWL